MQGSHPLPHVIHTCVKGQYPPAADSITAHDSDSIRKAAQDSGCVAYLTKPFLAKTLIDAINKAGLDMPTEFRCAELESGLGIPRLPPNRTCRGHRSPNHIVCISASTLLLHRVLSRHTATRKGTARRWFSQAIRLCTS